MTCIEKLTERRAEYLRIKLTIDREILWLKSRIAQGCPKSEHLLSSAIFRAHDLDYHLTLVNSAIKRKNIKKHKELQDKAEIRRGINSAERGVGNG